MTEQKRNHTSLLQFKLQLAEAFVAAPVANRIFLSEDEESNADQASTINRTKYYNIPPKKPYADKRYVGYNHFYHCGDISRPCDIMKTKKHSKTHCKKSNVFSM